MTNADDDIEEYLHPELDPTPSQSNGWIPPLFSLGGLLVGLHFLLAGALLPSVWNAVQNGTYLVAGGYAVVSLLLLVAGFAAGTMATRR